MQLGQLYRQVRDRFRAAGLPAADLDARILVSTLLDLSISDLILDERREIAASTVAEIGQKAKLRLAGMPVGRILGEREFYGRRFLLNSAALEPRPDTEVLIDAVLHRTMPDRPIVIWDIGTGSGAIAVTLLAELPLCQAIAFDLSEDALACAAGNARLHDVDTRFQAVCADFLSSIDTCCSDGPDWIISNPPYIQTDVLSTLDPEVIHFDPLLALDGGKSGLEAYVCIITDAAKLMKQGTGIAFEIGFDQAADVEKQLRHHGFGAIEIIKDLSGNDRVVLARRA